MGEDSFELLPQTLGLLLQYQRIIHRAQSTLIILRIIVMEAMQGPRNKFLSPISQLQITTHRVNLIPISNAKDIKHEIRASGYLVGKFYENVPIYPHEEVEFIGDFHGYFEDLENLKKGKQFFFEGRIENFKLISINTNQEQDPEEDRIKKLDESEFVGYFSGVLQKIISYNIDNEILFANIGQFSSLPEEVTQSCLIIPVFTSFLMKKVSAIHLEKSLADVHGILKVSVQLTPKLVSLFKLKYNKDLRLLLLIQRESTLELPLTMNANLSDIYENDPDSELDIEMSFDQVTNIMHYTILKKFQAEIDGSYKQFYAPFNLGRLKIVLSFPQLKVYYKSRNQTIQTILLKFNNFDFDDTINDNPYVSFNDLQRLPMPERKQKLTNRATKISFLASIDTGQFTIAANCLSLFTFYSVTFGNSDKHGSDWRWSLGISEQNVNVKLPSVKSIEEEFKSRKDEKPQKIFVFNQWNCVHIDIPIYKSWTVNFIQILIPIFILAVLSLFIFVQQNGLNSSGFTTLNARIVNVASIMIAYVAMIPIIRQNGPRASNIAFVYIVIYFSSVPHFLALASSIMNKDKTTVELKNSYDPFMDTLFLIAFIVFIVMFSLVIVQVLYFIKLSYSDFQRAIPRNFYKSSQNILLNDDKEFEFLGQRSIYEAKSPQMFIKYKQLLEQKRKNQYKMEEYSSPEQCDRQFILQ